MGILDVNADFEINVNESVLKFIKSYYGNYNREDQEYLNIFPYLIHKDDRIRVSVDSVDPYEILYIVQEKSPYCRGGRYFSISNHKINDIGLIGYPLNQNPFGQALGFEIRLKDVFTYINMYKKGRLGINFIWELGLWGIEL